MALTPGTVGRDNEATGQAFRIFETGGFKYQGMVVCDETGAHSGIAGTPLVVGVEGLVVLDDSTPIDVNIAAGLADPLPVSVQETLIQYDSGASAVASADLVATASTLWELRVLLDPAAVTLRYLMLFDLATGLPANGAVPMWRGMVPGAGMLSETWVKGLPFTNGIVAALSTTITTLTVTGAEGYVHAVRG